MGLWMLPLIIGVLLSQSPLAWADTFSIQDRYAFGNLVIHDQSNAIIAPDNSLYDWAASSFLDDDGKYKMWWTRQDPHDRIWYAESQDGIHWYNARKVLSPVNDQSDLCNNCVCYASSSCENYHVAHPSVVKLGGTYYMFYEAPNGPQQPNGTPQAQSQIFLATSINGVDWTRYCTTFCSQNPPQPTPILALPPGTQANTYGIGMPNVIIKDGQFHMFYLSHYTDDTSVNQYKSDQLAHAVTTDPRNWGTVASHQIVVKEGPGIGVTWNSALNKYVMLFVHDGSLSTFTRSLYIFTSVDGINWINGDGTPYYAPRLPSISMPNNEITSSGGFSNPRSRGFGAFVGTDTHGIVNTSSMLFTVMDGDIFVKGGDLKATASAWNLYSGTVKLNNDSLPLNFHENLILRDTTTGGLFKINNHLLHPYINWGSYTFDNPGKESDYVDIDHFRVLQHTQGHYWAERHNMYRPATGQIFYIENFTIYPYSSWAHYISYPGNTAGNWFSVNETEFNILWNDLTHGPYRP